ncbi:MAG: cation:proton antiporter [Nitrososphaeraceae archaeon]
MAVENEIFHIMITLGILLFSAKIFAEIFSRLKLPVVLGELVGGIVAGPFALGSFPIFEGKPLVLLDETIHHIGEISAVVVLFIAGLEITPREFLRGGLASFSVGLIGVVFPFFVGYMIFLILGLETIESLLIATALTATSIAITIQVLTELGKMKTREARLILGAAIADDILAIAALSVVTTMVQTGELNPTIPEISFLILEILGIFAILLVATAFIIPRIVHVERLWKSRGSVEGIITASFFGAAGIGAFFGLSPIVGAFAVGMAVSSTKIIERVKGYVHKLEIIFVPLFFAIIGAQVDLRGINSEVLVLSGIVIAIAIITKLVGCSACSMLFLKNKGESFRVGVSMISRGEVGLIVAGVGVTFGVIDDDIYTTIILMVAVTTIITPILLKYLYRREDEKTKSLSTKP